MQQIKYVIRPGAYVLCLHTAVLVLTGCSAQQSSSGVRHVDGGGDDWPKT